MSPLTPNPWGLTHRECDALIALTQHGAIEPAGKAIGVSYSQITNLISQVKKRMKTKSLIHCVLQWDRWARESLSETEIGESMVLTDKIIDLIANGVADDPDSMLPHCYPRTRQQVMTAVRNAVQKGRIHLVGRVETGEVRGQRLGVYAIGPGTPAVREKRRTFQPASSVFEWGAQA